MLNRVEAGEQTKRPDLLIAHGLYGSARNWGVLMKRLSDKRRVIAVDMRNHGSSPWFDKHSYADMAEDLAGEITAPVDVLGHSMGGKAAMVLALTRPDLVNRLIVADIAPVGYRTIDMAPIEAMRAVDLERITRRSEARKQMTNLSDPVAAFLLQSLDLQQKKWDLNLDVLEREMSEIRDFPQMTGHSFHGPALFLTGALSEYVRATHHPTIHALFPNARFVSLQGAGHWLHAEKPREFEAEVRTFLGAD